MRISDWSSDVCSSDLCCPRCRARWSRKSARCWTRSFPRPRKDPTPTLLPQAGEGLWSTCRVQARARGCSPSHKNIAICLTSAEGLRVPREQPLRRLALGVLDLAHERIRIAKLLERRHAPLQEALQLAQPGKLRRSARECQQRGHARQLQRLAEAAADAARTEEHTSELPSLMHISYAVVCLKHIS